MRQRGERVLGPYEQHNGFRVVSIYEDGTRKSFLFKTKGGAERFKAKLEAKLEAGSHTTASAIDEYEKHIKSTGWKQESVDSSIHTLRLFFPDPIPLALLSAKRCAKLYEDLRTRSSARSGKPFSVDVHRNALSRSKGLLAFCVQRGWLRTNPLADVKGLGKRRPRGLSLGKEGNELRVSQARAWYGKALELAADGDEGAVAGLIALLLGMRATEIVTRRVNDLDTDEHDGDLLWIPSSKTPAGRRTLEVPDVLRPVLLRQVAGKPGASYMFVGRHRGHKHRQWVRDHIKRICDLAGVPRVTAHAMRSQLATITAERGLAGHLIAATLGHADPAVTMRAYAAPGSASAGDRRRGLTVLKGGK